MAGAASGLVKLKAIQPVLYALNESLKPSIAQPGETFEIDAAEVDRLINSGSAEKP